MKCRDCLFYSKMKQSDSSDAMVCLHDRKKRWLMDGCIEGREKILERESKPPCIEQKGTIKSI